MEYAHGPGKGEGVREGVTSVGDGVRENDGVCEREVEGEGVRGGEGVGVGLNDGDT